MWNAIQKQFKIQWRDGLWMKLLMVGMALFGMGLMYILAVATKEQESWFAMGTFLAGFAAGTAPARLRGHLRWPPVLLVGHGASPPSS